MLKRRKEDKKQEREKDRECRRPKSEKRVEKSPARVEGYGGFFLRPEGLCEIGEWDGVMWNNKKKERIEKIAKKWVRILNTVKMVVCKIRRWW